MKRLSYYDFRRICMMNLIKKENTYDLIRDILIIEIGLAISSLGTAVFYAADLGSGAMATFSDGLHLLIHVSYGNANMFANIVFLIVLFLLDRKYINVGTILCVFTIGIWVDIFTDMLSIFDIASMNMVIRIIFTLIGASLMGIGLGLYMATDRGYGALEGIVKYIATHTSLSTQYAKIIQDVVLSVAGILLGAAWGVGTIVGIVVIGPILQRSSNYFTKLINK